MFSFGGQQYCGSTGNIALNQPVVGMAMTPDSGGYWLVAADGGVFTFGTAQFYGSTGAIHLNQPIVGMAATPDGRGYWLVAADGGVFTFGDAQFYGSGASVPNAHVIGLASTPDGEGYWEATSNGTVLAFGDAGFFGDAHKLALAAPIVGIAPDPVTGGYWLVGADGGVFDFNAPFLGSAGGVPLRQPVVGLRPPTTVTATGSWPRTAGSSPTATRPSAVRRAARGSTRRWWASPGSDLRRPSRRALLSEQPRCAPAPRHDRRQEVGVALDQHGPLVEAIDVGPAGLGPGWCGERDRRGGGRARPRTRGTR